MKPLALACGWVQNHLDEFAIVDRGIGLVPSVKALTELFHAGDLLARTKDPELNWMGDWWMDFVWEQIHGGALIERMIAMDVRLLPAVATFMGPHIRGRRNESLYATVAAQLEGQRLSPLVSTLLRPTLRILEIEAHPDLFEGPSRSVLENRPDPMTMTFDEAYMFTHEAFYVTTWGTAPSTLDATTVAWVNGAIPLLAERYAYDPDLIAELIVASHLLYLPSCVSPRLLEIVEAAQRPDGSIVVPEAVDDPSTALFKRYRHPRLERTYHATLVAIMAWSLHLQSCSSATTSSVA